jgi:hypothetical protein
LINLLAVGVFFIHNRKLVITDFFFPVSGSNSVSVMHFPDIGSFFKGRVKLVKLLDIRVVTIGFLRPYRLFSGIFLCGTILKAAPNKKSPHLPFRVYGCFCST